MRVPLLTLAVMASCSSEGTEVADDATPILDMPAQARLDTAPGCSSTTTIPMTNLGSNEVVVTDLRLEGDSRFAVDKAGVPVPLRAGETTELAVTLDGSATGQAAAILTVETTPRGLFQVALAGEVASVVDRVDRFPPAVPRALDMIVAVDQSWNAGLDRAALGTRFNALATASTTLGIDWRILFVTADDGCRSFPVIDATTPDASTRFFEATNGPSGDWTEALVYLGRLAVEQLDDGACNEGFRRPAADFVTVFVSDAAELSVAGATREWQDLLALEPTAVPAAIAGGFPIPECRFAQAGAGYYQVAVGKGGGFLDICDPDWPTRLIDGLPFLSRWNGGHVGLPATTEPDSIVVRTGGIETDAWKPTSEGLQLDDLWPRPDTTVSYRYAPTCP